jgi:hypothetical protein
MKRLRTAQQVIDRLGGLNEIARMTATDLKSAYNWPRFGQFPSSTYVVMIRALHRRGFTAPAPLWGMRMPARSKRAA